MLFFFLLNNPKKMELCNPLLTHFMSRHTLRFEGQTNLLVRFLKMRLTNNMATRINNNYHIRHVFHAVDLVAWGRTNRMWQHQSGWGISYGKT